MDLKIWEVLEIVTFLLLKDVGLGDGKSSVSREASSRNTTSVKGTLMKIPYFYMLEGGQKWV